MEWIEGIPSDGDEMISFGPNAEHVELTFTCAGRLRSIGSQGFTVTFAGCQVLDKESATVSLTRRFFRIADARGGERTVAIAHCQLPPPPTTFEVNGKRLTLLTMETRDGQRLFPDYFQIVRA